MGNDWVKISSRSLLPLPLTIRIGTDPQELKQLVGIEALHPEPISPQRHLYWWELLSGLD